MKILNGNKVTEKMKVELDDGSIIWIYEIFFGIDTMISQVNSTL